LTFILLWNKNPLAKWNPIQEEAKDAARSDNASKLRDSLTRGADVLDRGLILSALESGDVATFQTILDFGVDINQEMGYSGTPLISALQHNHQALLEFLFSKGVDPNKGNWGHWLPPLSVAVRYTKDTKWMHRPLDAGAKLQGRMLLRFKVTLHMVEDAENLEALLETLEK
jgi:hypothetical protein